MTCPLKIQFPWGGIGLKSGQGLNLSQDLSKGRCCPIKIACLCLQFPDFNQSI